MMRFPEIDGLRGFLLMMMTATHLRFLIDADLPHAIQAPLGWFQSAQGFLFLSGLVIALVGGKRYLGGRPVAAWIMRRCLDLFFFNAAAVAFVTLLAVNGWGPPALFDRFGDNPLLFGVLSAFLVAGPMYVDVLPMYVVFLLFTPLMIGAVLRGHAVLVAGISITLWFVAQLGLSGIVLGAAGSALGLHDQGIELGTFFDRMAWQVVYVGGVITGAKLAQGQFDTSFFRSPTGREILALCLVVMSAGMVLKVVTISGLVSLPEITSLDRRAEFGPLYALTFLAYVYAISWLLIAGPDVRSGGIRRLSAAFRRFALLPPLVFLGQHSLAVYTWHVFVVYTVGALVTREPATGIGAELIVIGAILALFAGAGFEHLATQRGRRQKSGQQRLATGTAG